MVKVTKKIVSNSLLRSRSNGTGNPVNYIVVHETANTAQGANAELHARLQSNGNSRQASWHYTCGSDGVYQSFPDNYKCWHAGSSYNNNSIGVEIAVNSDGNFKKAVNNAVELVKSLMKKHNVPLKNVITHKHASTWNKPCPSNLLSGNKGITWSQFKSAVKSSSGKVTSSGSSKSPAKKTKWRSVGSKWTGQNLKLNDKGGAVKQLQKAVGVTADGMFGAKTESAVKSAQKKAGIAVDGIAGKDSFAKFGKQKKVSNPSSQTSITKNIQKWVKTKADGISGPNTWRQLTKKLQRELNKQFKAGLSVDGIWGGKTRAAVVNVRPGSRGNLTRVLQSALYLKGHTVVGKPDGINGKNTQKGLADFQSKNGLSVDKIAGKSTFAALFK